MGLLLLAAVPVLAQVKFSTVITDREISKDDYLQVEYVVENASSVASLTPPAFKGFTVVSGPMQQTGMSVINGAVSKYEGVTYVLKPNAAGRYTISGATAVVNGKAMQSNSVSVTVTNTASSSRGGSQPLFGLPVPDEAPEVNEEYVLRKGERAADKIKDNLFVKLEVSKNSCYVGEPVVATYKLYSRLKSESRVSKRPSLSQFSVYDMVMPESNSPTIEKVNGKLYNTHIIRKVQLYPLQDGVFVLDPVEVDNTVRFLRLEAPSKITMQQLLDDYMNGVTDGVLEEQKVTLSSKPVTITVKPLPEGKPASFDGAVGKFTIMASVPTMNIAANETAVLDIILKGQGNLPLINAPQVQWQPGTEGYEPSVKETIDKTIAPISGTKMFEYSFTAKQPGSITLPPVEFSYFDPSANAYKTIRTEPVSATIRKSNKKRSVLADPQATGNETGINWKKFLWLSPLVLLILLALLFNLKRMKPLYKNAPAPAPVVTEAPPPAPVDLFEAARMALAAVNSQLFYKEIGKAVWHLLATKFSLPSSQLNKPVVVRLLQQSNAPAATIQLLETVLNDCELALYTPVHTENELRETLDKAVQLEQALAAVG
ncbi:MAG TPA: BatD family protein [Chitinophagaceae bacterium]|nr:BatD family protein [Chitinophagaceae bacterium]